MDLRPVLEQAISNTTKIVENVRPNQLGGPTPCDEFDVRALVNHLIGGNYLFLLTAQGQKVDPSRPAPDLAGDDPAGAYRNATQAALEMWNAPGSIEKTVDLPGIGNAPAALALGIHLMETIVHGWDLAKATGQDATIDPQIALGMLAAYQANPIPPQFRAERGALFRPEVKVPDNASPGDKLVAYLGRTP